MFLNHLKDFAAKKIVKNQLEGTALLTSEEPVRSIGILIDESYFPHRRELVEALRSEGLDGSIDVLAFRDKVRKNETFDHPVFSHADISWTATITRPQVRKFIDTPFDLLIDYFDVEKAALLLVSHLSKARFKAGFASVDKRLHHFMIDTTAENYGTFAAELAKYLRILNKIK